MKFVPDALHSKTSDSKTTIRRVETVGLVLLSLIVLIVTIIRYWGHIPWSAR